MRKLIWMATLALTALLSARGETETIGNYTWTYKIVGNSAEICNGYN